MRTGREEGQSVTRGERKEINENGKKKDKTLKLISSKDQHCTPLCLELETSLRLKNEKTQTLKAAFM